MTEVGTRRVGSGRVRRRVAGRSRPVRVSRGVLAVDPERRQTGVLVGVTLLALLVGVTAVASGVARLSLDDPGGARRVVLLSEAGVSLGTAPVQDDGSWTVSLRGARVGTVTAVVLQGSSGPVASGQLDGC